MYLSGDLATSARKIPFEGTYYVASFDCGMAFIEAAVFGGLMNLHNVLLFQNGRYDAKGKEDGEN